MLKYLILLMVLSFSSLLMGCNECDFAKHTEKDVDYADNLLNQALNQSNGWNKVCGQLHKVIPLVNADATKLGKMARATCEHNVLVDGVFHAVKCKPIHTQLESIQTNMRELSNSLIRLNVLCKNLDSNRSEMNDEASAAHQEIVHSLRPQGQHLKAEACK